MKKAKQKKQQHELNDAGTSCKHCGTIASFLEFEDCEKEDLSMWCAPGQSVSEMLEQAARKD